MQGVANDLLVDDVLTGLGAVAASVNSRVLAAEVEGAGEGYSGVGEKKRGFWKAEFVACNAIGVWFGLRIEGLVSASGLGRDELGEGLRYPEEATVLKRLCCWCGVEWGGSRYM